MNLTPAQHLKAAQQARLAAHHHSVASEFARERGDTIGSSEAVSEQQFHLAVAEHHEAAAAAATREPVVEGLTDGPVHVADTTPGDEAIAEG